MSSTNLPMVFAGIATFAAGAVASYLLSKTGGDSKES
jgi:hypothetical protein